MTGEIRVQAAAGDTPKHSLAGDGQVIGNAAERWEGVVRRVWAGPIVAPVQS